MAQHLARPRPTGPTAADLPTYLGFGLLDQGSVRFEDGWLTATYSDEHDLVYEVRWNPNGCVLKSYWRGRELGRSGGPDLQKAFFYSWHGAEKSWEDQRFIDLSNEIIRAGNVHFVFPRPEQVFFPAGLLFTLRQPITQSSLAAWEALKPVFESAVTPEPRPRLYREGPGSIVHLLEGGDTWTERVLVVDLSVPLARVVQAVARCVQGGIVPGGSIIGWWFRSRPAFAGRRGTLGSASERSPWCTTMRWNRPARRRPTCRARHRCPGRLKG